MELIIQLILGALGGNGAGALLKKFSLGTIGNSVAGILGGGIGGMLLSGAIEGYLGDIVAGGLGGGILMAIVGFIKNLLDNR